MSKSKVGKLRNAKNPPSAPWARARIRRNRIRDAMAKASRKINRGKP